MLDKAYNPQNTEDRIYKMWEDTGAFTADVSSSKDPFVITMPPPNATGTLHLGHAVMLALEDIFTRFARMQGKEALWVPGTDHAAIATENVVIKKISKEEKMKDPRATLGREEVLKRIIEFVDQSQDTIRGQVRKMGSSCDWSREGYTMDATRHRIVNEVFTKMYEDGLIYRGHRTVNWDPKLQTNVSDDEVDYKDRTDPFYWFQYGPFVIGTVRPETKFDDKYVVMHPDDERYKDYKHGDTFECEWITGKITATVIKDEAADPEMGSGCMTITPWHSAVDFEIAERHGLDKQQIIDFDGKLMEPAGEFAGMTIDEARPALIEHLEKKDLVVKVDESYEHAVATNSRGGGIIEPQIREQWFIDINKKVNTWKGKWAGKSLSLKDVMLEVVRDKSVEIIPERFEKTYFHWIENLRDWCISRQIWWGHRIPVWYDNEGNVYNKKPQKLIFARHGQSTGNRDQIIQTSQNPLTDKGKEHAVHLLASLKERNITKIISSPAIRALETAQIVADHFGVEVQVLEELNQFNFGDIEGQPSMAKQGTTPIVQAIEAGTGEGIDAFYNRCESAWKKLQLVQASGEVLVVGHRTNFSAIDVIREGGKPEDIISKREQNEEAAHGLWGEYRVPEELADKELTQDPDTLDTWFSSALWTWSTLIDPRLAEDYSLSLDDLLEQSPDMQKFHPTQVMETGYDIIFFWVARMILMTTYNVGQIPFETVYLHGMVRTRDGKKMSKSDPSTTIDPLEIIPDYGADALRLSMIVGQSPGNDFRLYKEKIAGYRNFINKLWNASRFVLMQCEEAKFDTHAHIEIDTANLSLADKALLDGLQQLTDDVTKGLEEYRLSEVGEKLYSFVWDFFCDWYLELSKGEANHELLVHALRTILQLLHPYCPFVTEELWNEFKPEGEEMLLKHKWPVADDSLRDADSADHLQRLIGVISAIRKMRSEQGIEPGKQVSVTIRTSKWIPLIEMQEAHIRRLTKTESLTVTTDDPKLENAVTEFLPEIEVHLSLEGLVDKDAEIAKLSAEKEKLSGFITGLEKKLGNSQFVDNAPEEVITREREKLESNQEKLKKVEERLQGLS